MRKPYFSVVVVSLNAGTKIKTTIDSVLNQTFPDFEIIVKDGISKDQTLSYVAADERIHIISKKDRSVYDGMNQALENCSGQLVIFMNCGDCFADATVLKRVYDIAKGVTELESSVLYGDYIKSGQPRRQPEVIDKQHLLMRGGLCHQSVFFGREVFHKIGTYDTSFPICADYELMARAYMQGIPYVYLPIPVCIYEGGGISEQETAIQAVKAEGKRIRQKYFTKMDCMRYTLMKAWRRMRWVFCHGG